MPYVRRRRGFGDVATTAAIYVGANAAAPDAGNVSYCSQGRWNWLSSATCWGRSLDSWIQLAAANGISTGPIAPPSAPSGDLLTLPPASGESAQQTVDALLNQQTLDQQARNADNVQSNSMWQFASGIVDTGNAIADAAGNLNPANWSLPWGTIALVGVASVLALAAVGAGSPRRYGR